MLGLPNPITGEIVMKVGIIGAGYVGKAIGTYLREKEHDVIFYDNNPKVVDELQKKGLLASGTIEDSAKMRYIFISVPTPTDEKGNQVLDYIISAITNLATTLKETSEEHIIIIKSTILPGTTEKLILPIIYKHITPEKVGVLYSPEFLTEIHGTWAENDKYAITVQNEYRLVIGEGKNKKWGDILLRELYSDIEVPVIRTNYTTAEIIKYASNNALAAKISYWNEVFLVCQEIGIDSEVVAKAASLDPRIGEYGTVHGKAFGGKCLPKDLKAFINFARIHRETPFHEAIDKVNEYMKIKYGVRE